MKTPSSPSQLQDFARMQESFIRFSEQAAESKIYSHLSKKMAADSELLELATQAQAAQPPIPNLFFAAVNDLLYRNPDHPLCGYYPNHSGRAFTEAGAFESFKAFCLEHAKDINATMQIRLVQTNEVRRCALFLPGLGEVAKLVTTQPKTLALVDVGTSSGLNLMLDRYCYEYSDGHILGNTESKLRISCELLGQPFELGPIPQIAQRIGIDLNPIDLTEPNELRWALALIWPDQLERIERLKTAAQVLQEDPAANDLKLIQGSANEVLPSVLENLPAGMPVCVMHSFVLNQFSTEDRALFAENLAQHSLDRDIYRLSLEWIGTEHPELHLTAYSGGRVQEGLECKLASCHHHGEWLAWHGR